MFYVVEPHSDPSNPDKPIIELHTDILPKIGEWIDVETKASAINGNTWVRYEVTQIVRTVNLKVVYTQKETIYVHVKPLRRYVRH